MIVVGKDSWWTMCSMSYEHLIDPLLVAILLIFQRLPSTKVASSMNSAKPSTFRRSVVMGGAFVGLRWLPWWTRTEALSAKVKPHDLKLTTPLSFFTKFLPFLIFLLEFKRKVICRMSGLYPTYFKFYRNRLGYFSTKLWIFFLNSWCLQNLRNMCDLLFEGSWNQVQNTKISLRILKYWT